jgi:N-methylhydantoinase A
VSYRIGVDIGGTFADFCALDEATGRLATLKVLSTPQEPGREVIAGLAELGSRFGIHPQDIGYFTHGTTVGINALLERKGARTVLRAGGLDAAPPVRRNSKPGRPTPRALFTLIE